VQINDLRWPSLREAARRFLRTEGCNILVPKEHETDAHKIIQLISDYIPERLELPLVKIGILSSEGLFQIGGLEPDIAICWVPEATWSDFEEQVIELLQAGYPGCVGCGGPGAEGEWNEVLRRKKMSEI
jgi:hypothetical protein